MKLEQQQQAHHLYFQTELSKTEIADTLGINRRTLHNWIHQANWEQIKKNAENIPSFLAENCYQVLGNFSAYLLSEARIRQPVTIQEVNAMYKLTLTINKLKAKTTLNESMEALTWFMDSLNSKAPKLAQQVQPHLDEYITTRAAQSKQYKQSKKDAGQNIEKANEEAKLDTEDIIAWSKQENETPAAYATPAIPPFPSSASFNAAGSAMPAKATVKPSGSKSIREMLRGTATTGPSKVLRRNQPIAA